MTIDIERMAREAETPAWGDWFSDEDALARFAALVAAETRERCAAILDANADACNPYSTSAALLKSNAAAIRAGGKP